MLNYSEICDEILGAEESSPRGMLIKEILACQIELSHKDIMLFHDLLPDNVEYLNAELNWYIRGEIDDLSITEHAKIWRNHIQDGKLNSNYGYWLGPKGNNTLKKAIDILHNDRDSRRAIALIGDASCVEVDKSDVPCTQSLQFLIRNGWLTTIINMRSQDIWFGFRNDVPFFQLISQVVSEVVSAPIDRLYLNVGSLHAYERHWPKLEKIAKTKFHVMGEEFDLSEYREAMITHWRLDK